MYVINNTPSFRKLCSNMSNNLSVFIIKTHTFVIAARCIDKVLFIEHFYRIYFAFSFSNHLTRLSRDDVSVLYKTFSQIYLLFWIIHVENRLWFFVFLIRKWTYNNSNFRKMLLLKVTWSYISGWKSFRYFLLIRFKQFFFSNETRK